MIRSRVSTSTSQSTITRRPFALTISNSATAQSATLFRLLRNDHCRHKSGNIAKLPFAIRLAPGKQQLVGNSMSARRRRCQSWTRKALLNYPQLFCSRPSTAATRVNNFKAIDVASVAVKMIHTDNSYRPDNSTRRPTSDEYLSSSRHVAEVPAARRPRRESRQCSWGQLEPAPW